MNIIQANLSFPRIPVNRTATIGIIYHHTASDSATPQQIRDWHVNGNGWGWVGYTFLVRRDGSVRQMLPITAQGIHTAGHNHNTIGIAFEGNFENQTMPTAQFNAGVALTRHLLNLYPDVWISKHNSKSATLCPGRNFPFQRMTVGAQSSPSLPRMVRVRVNTLNIRSRPSWDASAIAGTVRKGEAFTPIERRIVGNTPMFKLKSGLWITGNTQFVDLLT